MPSTYTYAAVACCNFIMMRTISAAVEDNEDCLIRNLIGMTDERAAQIRECPITEALAKIISNYFPKTTDALAFIDEMEKHSSPYINEILERAKDYISIKERMMDIKGGAQNG